MIGYDVEFDMLLDSMDEWKDLYFYPYFNFYDWQI